MIYSFDSRVRYSEVGHDYKMKLTSIIDYFQDCSSFHSEEVGVGVDYLKKNHKIWFLAGWQIIIERYPKFNEKISTMTWPYEFKNVYGFRNFAIRDEAGKNIAYANSIWVMLDTETGKICRPDEKQYEAYKLEPKLEMDYAPRKIKISGEAERMKDFVVENHHLDTNGHVNNVQYVLMAMEYIPQDLKIGQLRVEYKNQATAGNIIRPLLYKNDSCYTVSITDGTDKCYAVVEFK